MTKIPNSKHVSNFKFRISSFACPPKSWRRRGFRISRGGVSLIEVLVYVAIFAVLSALAVNFLLLVSYSLATIRVTRTLNQTATVAMERMIREIRQARDVIESQSTLGISPGILALDIYVEPGSNATTTRKFSVSGGTLTLEEGSATAALTSVAVTNLIFWSSTTPSSQAVHVELTVSAGAGRYIKQQTFYGTAVLRGSY